MSSVCCVSPDLPELHLYSTVQLNKSRLEVQVLTVWIIDINCTLLVLMLVDVTKVSPQLLTHAQYNIQ